MNRLHSILVIGVVAFSQGCGTIGGDRDDVPSGPRVIIDSPATIEETDENARDRQSMQQPAVLALLTRAERDEQQGKLDAAAANLERALRINSRDAVLWSRLAQLRFRQQRYKQAIDLALKSNGYASSDRHLQASNWRIIHRVRTQLGDYNGAKEALKKAEGLED